jgi:uncharacterized protein involved in exopolysaccharide biosynthesis
VPEAKQSLADAGFPVDELDRETTAEPIAARPFSREAIALIWLLWDRRPSLYKAAIAGFIGSVVFALLIPARYQSTTRLMPPDDKSSSGGLSMLAALAGSSQLGGLGALAGDALGMKSSGALFVGILQSRTVEDRVVNQFDLQKVYGEKFASDARKKLESNTSISEDRKSGIISITTVDHDPRRASAISAAYVDELDRMVSQLSTSAAHKERVFLEGRLTGVKSDLDSAAQKFGQFASKNAAIDIQAQSKAMVDAAAQLQGQLIAAESQLQGLRQIYTENNVRVREIEARIGELQRQVDKLGGTPSIPSRDASMSGDDPPYPSIRQLPLLGITYADLYRRTKIEEVVYETLTQQYEMAKVQEAKETPSVKVLDAADVPERKSFPPRTLIALLGTFLAVCGASLWIAGNERWKNVPAEDERKEFLHELFRAIRKEESAKGSNGDSPS